jgi:N-(2-amino-2-carboxyethyl)-L-glutamate synthase
MGCARNFKERHLDVRVVAVDTVGSVTFGGPSRPRMLPGLGAGVRPPLLDVGLVDDVVHVPEIDAVGMCHRLARAGFLFGGSTGTVVSGASRWLQQQAVPGGQVTVAIAPDLGERYRDSVYEPAWVEDTYGSSRPAGELAEQKLMTSMGVA